MKKYLYSILSMAALPIASAIMLTACSSDDDIVSEQQPVQGAKTYAMTVNASKGGDATTRALSLDETTSPHKLNATWDENEEVLVYQGGSQIGTLYSAASTTNETELSGTLDSAPDAEQDLTFYFHTATDPVTTTDAYAGQDGTLAKIASTYDFCAPATITAGNFTVSGSKVTTTSSVSFGANQQSIVKFTLIDNADGTTLLNPSKITAKLTAEGTEFTTTEFTIPETTYETNGNGVVYFAIQNFPAGYESYKELAKLEFTATVGDDTYTYTKDGWPFEDGTYYEIAVKMTKQAAAAPTLAETMTTAGMTVKVNYNYGQVAVENYCQFLSNGDGTYTFQSGAGYAGGDNNCAKALVVEGGKLVFKQNFFAPIDNLWDWHGYSVTFDTSNNTYSEWIGQMTADKNPSFTSVEVNGTTIGVTHE